MVFSKLDLIKPIHFFEDGDPLEDKQPKLNIYKIFRLRPHEHLMFAHFS